MLYKHKFFKKRKSINDLVLRFRGNGCKFYHVYDIIVAHKKSRQGNGYHLDKLGNWNPNNDGKLLLLNSTKLYYWVQRGLVVNYKIKRHIIKFLLV